MERNVTYGSRGYVVKYPLQTGTTGVGSICNNTGLVVGELGVSGIIACIKGR